MEVSQQLQNHDCEWQSTVNNNRLVSEATHGCGQLALLSIVVHRVHFQALWCANSTSNRHQVCTDVRGKAWQQMSSCCSVAHDKQVRVPQHLCHWHLCQRLWILGNCQCSIQTQHPNGVVSFCDWLQIHSAFSCVHSHCLRRAPCCDWYMYSAAQI